MRSRARRAGRLDAAGLRAAEDEAIRGIVAFQDEIGMPAVTDGEFRRRSWSAGVIDALDGFAIARGGGAVVQVGAGGWGRRGRGRLALRRAPAGAQTPDRRRRLPVSRLAVAQGAAQGDDRLAAGAALLPRPARVRGARPMPTEMPTSLDLVRIYRDEIADLAAAGCALMSSSTTPRCRATATPGPGRGWRRAARTRTRSPTPTWR